MRRSIATVCLSGSLAEKLHAAAAAGFDAVELFEPDLVASELSAEEVRALAARLGLELALYQPFRDFEGVTEELFVANLRRAKAKLELMSRLGIATLLVCSNVATATVDSDEVSAAQLRCLGGLAQEHGVRIAFEALAWGRFVDDYRRAWRIVDLADHPAVGVCLDSFHVLSRGHDPAAIEQIPSEKIFFVQLADAPALSMDVLSWSRHHRLFPGEGTFDLPSFLAHVLRTGYAGPLSLEVFNDVFRQTDVRRTAVHALRSVVWVEDAARRVVSPSGGPLRATAPPTGLDFVEIRAQDSGPVEQVLEGLGFEFRGPHRSKRVSLWESGGARCVINEEQPPDGGPRLGALGLEVADVGAAVERAQQLGAAAVYRRTYAGEVRLDVVDAPDGTQIFFGDSETARWREEFGDGAGRTRESHPVITHVDHVNLAQPWETFDESVLFWTSVLGLTAMPATEVAGPRGLVRSQVMVSPDGAVRLPLNVAPTVESGLPPVQHVAFACRDVVGLARRAREAGVELVPVPGNYYDDLDARLDVDPGLLRELRELGVFYDRDGSGEYLNVYTRTVGQVFIELVERRGDYQGYGSANASVRIAAQRR